MRLILLLYAHFKAKAQDKAHFPLSENSGYEASRSIVHPFIHLHKTRPLTQSF